MKKILFFLPLIVAVIFYAFIVTTGMKIESIPVNVALVCFLISGLLLSFGKAWGGIFAIIVSGLVFYNGFNNWKLGQLEISIGVTLLIFYLACSIYVYRKAKR